MEHIPSRGPARFVGYFDLILTITCTVVLIGRLTYDSLQTDPDFGKDSCFTIFLVIIGVVIGLWTVLFILTIICAVILTGEIAFKSVQTDLDSENDSSFNVFLVIVGMVIGLWTLLSIFLSKLLLDATNLTADPKTSLERIKLWLDVNISLSVLGIFSGINGLFRGEWNSLLVLLCVRGPLIWLVQCYKKELACHCADQQPSRPLPTTSE